jgi:hypothetical protein
MSLTSILFAASPERFLFLSLNNKNVTKAAAATTAATEIPAAATGERDNRR